MKKPQTECLKSPSTPLSSHNRSGAILATFLAALSALNCSTARAEIITIPDGVVPDNLVTSVGGSYSTDTASLNSTYGVGRAFDGAYYSDSTRWIGKSGTFPQRAVWTFPVATVVDTVRIYNANSDGKNQSPSYFTIAGSNDGENWTTLDTETNVSWTKANEFQTFGFSNLTPYRKYQIEVTGVVGGSRMTITEIEFYRLSESSFAVSAETPTSGTDSFSVEWTLAAGDGVTADAGLVWSTDETFATATTNSLGTGLSADTRTATLSGLEPDTTYWWKIVAEGNGAEEAESAVSSFTTKGAPVLGTATATVDGETASFSVALATAAMENTLATSVSVFYGTDGETWTELPLGSASEAQTFSGTVQSLGYGVTCQWYAQATATLAGGRVLSAQTDVASFTTLYNGDMYVDAAAQNATAPYSTPATAAKTIAAALATAADGATIHVADGTYYITSPIGLGAGKAVKIIGNDTDPSKVVISNTKNYGYNDSTHRCLTLNNADAWVSGLTLEKGQNGANGGNLYFSGGGGTVSNCIIRAGLTREHNDYANGSNVSIYGPGLVTHCRIIGGEGYGAKRDEISSVYLDNTAARIENSLITGFSNTGMKSRAYALLIEKGTAVNCTVVSNVSTCADSSTKIFVGIGVGSGGYVSNCVSACNVDASGVLYAIQNSRGSQYVNCAIDAVADVAEAVTDMVNPVTGTASSFFKDYANGDYTPAGPLVNKGANYDGMASVDLAGRARLVGRKVDIGCYEASSSAFVISVR